MTIQRKLKVALFAVLTCFVATSVIAASATKTLTSTRIKKGKPVVLGQWHAGFKACLNYAQENGVPLIAVWSNGDRCGHCVTFEWACCSKNFTKWMKTSGCVFFFVTPDDADGKNGGEAFNFAKGVSHGGKKNPYGIFPYVRVYWYVKGKKKVDITTSGDYVDGMQRDEIGGKNARDWLKKKLKAYTPKPISTYTGGEFAFPDYDQARLEAEAGVTTSVMLDISRTNKTIQAQISTNTVVAVFPDGHADTNCVKWASGETATNLTLDVSTLTNAGEQVILYLQDAAGKNVATSHVTAVKSVNSPRNPLWIGEKNEDELGFGEWTMDLDAATNKVKKFNAGSVPSSSPRRLAKGPSEKAHTLVLVSGAMWCPDCAAADKHLLGTTNFTEWAKAKNVALVVVDIPNLPSGKASLLTRDVNDTFSGPNPYRFVTANNTPGYTNMTARWQSGLGYLTRHGISDDEASVIAKRNASLAGHNTLDGGWNLPERANQNRVGVPTLIVLRDDGTVAGRMSQYSNWGPTSYEDGIFKRIEELFEIADSTTAESLLEEKNDSYKTATEVVANRGKVEGRTLSFTDSQDVYLLDPEESVNNRLNFTVRGEKDVLVELAVLSGDGTVKEKEFGSLKEGVSLAYTVPSSNYFVSVGTYKSKNVNYNNSLYPVDPYFAHTNTTSTLCEYMLETDFIALPGEVKRSVPIPDWENGMTIALEEGRLYRLIGIDPEAPENTNSLVRVTLDENDPGDLYRALVTADSVKLKLKESSVQYQIWDPGQVGFAVTSAIVSEGAGIYRISLVRTGGVSGKASLKLAFDENQKGYLSEIITLPDDFGEERVWLEGSNDVKTVTITINDNKYADGDIPLFFTCAPSGPYAAGGVTQMKITLRDNDMKKPGLVAVTESYPTLADNKNRIVFARSGDSVRMTLGRLDGADGMLTASLSASDGNLDATEFRWLGRDVKDQVATLTGLDEPGKTVTVLLSPAKGTKVDASRRKVVVKVLPQNVPGFETNSLVIAATRYVPIDGVAVMLDDPSGGGSVSVKKYSGSLATGLSWSVNDGKLCFSGVPKKAGTTTAVFRAFDGKTAGLTLAVTVIVSDPVLGGGKDDAGSVSDAVPLNPSVGVARTFADIPVFDQGTNRLAGVLTLTLPRTGRASAKYRTPRGVVSLSAANWNSIDKESGMLSVSLNGKLGNETYTLGVEAHADASVFVSLDDPSCPDGVTNLVSGEVWSKTNTASDFKGYYTVSMPIAGVASGTTLATGAGYATLKMNTAPALKAGKFTYAGLLPNGKPFSGSAVVSAVDWSDEHACWLRGIVPFVVVGDEDSLYGAVYVTPGASDPTAADMDSQGEYCNGRCSYVECRRSVHPAKENDIVWRHVERAEELSSEAVLNAFGTYYVSTESFVECCKNALGTDRLTFFSLSGLESLPESISENFTMQRSFLNAGAAALAGVNVTFKKLTKKAKTATNGIATTNTKKLKLSFSLATGIVSGTFPLTLSDGKKSVTLTYQGVVMPGWGSQGCTSCGVGGVDALARPFISGTAWFNDEYRYEDAKGRPRAISVRRSCPFSVGVEAGQ